MAHEIYGNLEVKGRLKASSDWVLGDDYTVGVQVSESNTLYRCLVDHTASTFSVDLAAAKWVAISASLAVKGGAAGTVPIASDGEATAGTTDTKVATVSQITSKINAALSGSSSSWQFESTDEVITATAGAKISMDTTGGPKTITMPAAPDQDSVWQFNDSLGTAGDNNITIDLNGKNVAGVAGPIIIALNNGAIDLLYDNSAGEYKYRLINGEIQ